MPYYRGDYYRGDYYRGDFWQGLGGAVKKIGSVIGGVATGGIAGGISALAGGSPGGGSRGAPPAPPGTIMQGGVFPTVREFFTGKPVPGQTTKGYHWNKSNEYDPSKHGVIVVPKHSKMVRNRHMNVANPRALARAARRAHGFLRMASKHIRYFKPHHPKGRPYIARKRKSR